MPRSHSRSRRRPGRLQLRPKAPRMAERLVEDIFTALDEQTVVVPGMDAATLIVPSLASSLQAVLDQRNSSPRESRNCWRLTLFPRSDGYARYRRQDRSQDPHPRRRRQQFPAHSGPRRLRRTRSDDPQLGLGYPRRTALPSGKQAAQTNLLPVRFRGPGRPGLAGLLRQEDHSGKAPHPSSALPRQTTSRRALRDARDGTFYETQSPTG